MKPSTQNYSSDEELDIKPQPVPTNAAASSSSTPTQSAGLSPSLAGTSKKWSPGSLQDANRKSAFQPYQLLCTVLTNLQRGNTQAETPVAQFIEKDFHMKAGQGELKEEDIRRESSVDVRDVNELTALHWAAAYGQYSTVELLLKKGAQADALGPEEETPLLLAASGGHHEVVRLLITQGKANVNHEDHLCNTALMYAAKGNHPHCCQELLLNGADFAMVNFNDSTAHEIAMANNSELAQAVIENAIIARLEGS